MVPFSIVKMQPSGSLLGLSRISILVANPLHTYAKLSLPPDHSTTLGIRGHLAGPLRVVMLQIDGMSTTLRIRHQYRIAGEPSLADAAWYIIVRLLTPFIRNIFPGHPRCNTTA